MKDTNGLRAGILARVSTEDQAARGESLLTQTKILERSVKNHNGQVVKRYIGQEHATVGEARKTLKKILEDIINGYINALFVSDFDRLGRDSVEVTKFLRELKRHKVDLFINTEKQNLNDPDTILKLALYSAVAENVGTKQAQKSLNNRIERANRGWPTVGSKPYGRKLLKNSDADKSGNAEWKVIPEKKELVRHLCHLYLEKDNGYEKISQLTGIETGRVRHMLIDYSGDTWTQRFRSKAGDIDVTVSTKIPPLLTNEQIEAIKQKAKANRQFRPSKQIYPLAHYIHCMVCGYMLGGGPTIREKRYYHHYKKKRTDRCTIKIISAEPLENAVFSQFGHLLRHQETLEEAIKQVITSTKEKERDLKQEKEEIEARLRTLQKKLNYLIAAITEGIYMASSPTKQRIDEDIHQIDHDILELTKDKDQIDRKLVSLNLKIPADLQARLNDLIFAMTGLNGHTPAAWPLAEQAKLAKFFFGMVDRELGVFVHNESNPEVGKILTYEVRGLFGTAKGSASGYPYFDDRVEEISSGQIDEQNIKDLIGSLNDKVLPRRSIKVSWPWSIQKQSTVSFFHRQVSS